VWKSEAASDAGAGAIPSGEAMRASTSTTANGPIIDASVARPLSDVLRQVHVGFGSAVRLWCIGHSVAPL
jgi:hypothetical protein